MDDSRGPVVTRQEVSDSRPADRRPPKGPEKQADVEPLFVDDLLRRDGATVSSPLAAVPDPDESRIAESTGGRAREKPRAAAESRRRGVSDRLLPLVLIVVIVWTVAEIVLS